MPAGSRTLCAGKRTSTPRTPTGPAAHAKRRPNSLSRVGAQCGCVEHAILAQRLQVIGAPGPTRSRTPEAPRCGVSTHTHIHTYTSVLTLISFYVLRYLALRLRRGGRPPHAR